MPEIISTHVICKQPGRYIGWPTVAATRSGELLAVFSGDRDAHVCPWGKTQLVRSLDGGATWSKPVTINNTPLDDRDAGIIETAKGTLLISWFTSLAFEAPGHAAWQKLPTAVTDAWKRHSKKTGPETRRAWLGNWVRRSQDNGASWGECIDSIVTAPHGPAQLSDGSLLYVGKNRKVGGGDSQPPTAELLAAAVSRDDGLTWTIAGYIPVPDDVKPGPEAFHEPHVVEAEPGRIVAMFRFHGTPGQYYLWQTESDDGGLNWSTLHQTDIWGYPPHLIRLSSGSLLVSYGRRKPPFGERACASRDGGRTWDAQNEVVIADAPNGDLGYPASVQLADGSIITVYYQAENDREKTCLMATRWRLDE